MAERDPTASPPVRASLGTVLLVAGATAGMAHVAALLRRFGYEVRELQAVQESLAVAAAERCEIELVVLDGALCTGSELDVVAIFLRIVSLASVLVVGGAAAREGLPERCKALPSRSSPLDFTVTILQLLQRRRVAAH